MLAAEPQNHGRDEHEHAGNAESERGPEMPQKDRHQERGEERAEVDDPVEGVENHLGAMLVRLVELVADKCGHTRFDPARAERDQPEPDVEAGAVRDKHRQARLTRRSRPGSARRWCGICRRTDRPASRLAAGKNKRR